MKAKNVKLKFNELHNGQIVFITDGNHIWPFVVGQKSTAEVHYQGIHIGTTLSKPFVSNQPAKNITTLLGDAARAFYEEFTKERTGLDNINSGSVTEINIVKHIDRPIERAFFGRSAETGDMVRILLTEPLFNAEDSNLRIFRKFKQAVVYSDKNLHNEYLIDMNDLFDGEELLIEHYAKIDNATESNVL